MNTLRYMALTLLAGSLCCNEINKNKPGSSEHTSIQTINTLRLQDLNQQPLDMNKYKGSIVFLNFWATWCKPCLEEMSSIEKAKTRLADPKVIFLLASNESTQQVIEFKTNHKSALEFVIIENMEDLNIQALPTTFIYNADGRLAFSETGYRKWDDSTSLEMIRKILK